MSELSIDMKFDGPLHKRVLEALNSRFRLSARKMSMLHKQWRNNEEQFIAYLPETELDAKRRLVREQSGKPQYTTVVLPYTYAMLMSAHSYWTTVFLSRDPVFQYTGRHGESQQQIQALEALIAYQVQVGKMLIPLYFWLLDGGKYGIGIMVNFWEEENSFISQYLEQPVIDPIMGLPTGEVTRIMQTQKVRGYYGNKLVNVRPYDYYPDPRVPLWNVQAGEFTGYMVDLNRNDLIRGKASGRYINTEKMRSQSTGSGRKEGTGQQPLPNASDDGELTELSAEEITDTGPYAAVVMYVDLIPKEWGLGSGQYPEKWAFTAGASGGSWIHPGAANLTAVIEARPLGCLHNKFPVSIIEMEPEAYAFASRGMPEVMRPLQQTMDWLLNSHMYNVRKTLNNQFVVDPSRVVMQDYLEPRAGGAIRLKPSAYGTDTRTALSQLQVSDVTRTHVGDISFLHEFAQRAIGVNDQIMGLLNAGGRKTAQEVRTSSTFGVNRQKTISEIMSAMGWAPLSEQLVANSQQYFDTPTKLKIVGDLVQEAGPRFLQVDPDAIQGFFDFVPVDGTMPIDRYQQANLWKEILVGLRQMPEIAAQYDIGRIFAWVAQLAGLKNINQFKIQVLPPGMAPPSNVVPMPMRGPPGPIGPGGGTPPDLSRTIEPGQIPGMGTSG